MATHRTAESRDGVKIAYDLHGAGDPLVLVEPPLRNRASSAYAGLVPLLAKHFSVICYDRRGRGDSADAGPYAPTREVEDLAAVIDAVGRPAHLHGYSSGALLALHGAAAGLPIRRLSLLEPPLHDAGHDFTEPDPLTREVSELIDRGERDEAVLHFHRRIGVPDEFLMGIRTSPGWEQMRSMAHTLVYDCRISDATTPEVLAGVSVQTLVVDSTGSTENLSGWAATVAAQLPNARHRSLPGEWHTVADDVLAPVLVDFFQQGE